MEEITHLSSSLDEVLENLTRYLINHCQVLHIDRRLHRGGFVTIDQQGFHPAIQVCATITEQNDIDMFPSTMGGLKDYRYERLG